MPLKYKMLVFLFSLGIMLIGLGTFSMISPNAGWIPDFNSGDREASEVSTFGSIQSVDGKSEGDIQSELEELVKRYFTAKQQVDMKLMKQCVSDISNVEERKLMAEAEYVESYEDIQCLVLDGPKEGTYRVYVYCGVKIYDIDTLIPSLVALYITMNEDHEFQVYIGTLESKEQKYIDELDQSDRVQSLIQMVQNNMEDVISTDSKVRDFYGMLESVD